MIDIILKIYMSANLFLAGYYLAENYKWQDTISEKIMCLLWCLGTIFFGCIYITIVFVWVFILETLKKIDAFLQVSFWFTYIFTKRWHNIEKNELDRINNICINFKNKNTTKDKIYRYCTSLINKRNNYVYIESKEIPF